MCTLASAKPFCPSSIQDGVEAHTRAGKAGKSWPWRPLGSWERSASLCPAPDCTEQLFLEVRLEFQAGMSSGPKWGRCRFWKPKQHFQRSLSNSALASSFGQNLPGSGRCFGPRAGPELPEDVAYPGIWCTLGTWYTPTMEGSFQAQEIQKRSH